MHGVDEVNKEKLPSPSQNSGIRGHPMKLSHRGIREGKISIIILHAMCNYTLEFTTIRRSCWLSAWLASKKKRGGVRSFHGSYRITEYSV